MTDSKTPLEDAPADGGTCTLCGLPTPSPPVTANDVDGTFCCAGCLQIQQTLGDLDPEAQQAVTDAVEDDTSGGRTSSTGAAEQTTDGDTAFFFVDGMHCSTCEAFIEGRGRTTDGISSIEASYATDTIRVTYDPEILDENDVAAAVSGHGYTARDRDEHRDSTSEAALAKFLVGGGLFGMMVMVWYGVFLYPTYFGYDPVIEFGGYDGLYVFGNIWLMTTFVLFYTGWPILRGAYVSLRAGQPNMDLLISLAAISAYVYSTLAMIVGRTDLYFDVSVAIILVVTAGTYYEGRIKDRATGLLSDLTAQRVEEARRAADGEIIPVDDISPGEHVLVQPGERVPVDGVVIEGTAAIDESLVTGEPLPVSKSADDFVRGGTLVTDQPLVIAAETDGESTLDRLVELLFTIQSSRPGIQRLADKLATIFVPLVIVIATIVTGWLLLTGASVTTALLVGLTVLIVTCPCALGLATPLAIASGVQSGAKRGIVIASETIFESAADVDVVVLDKTGTLTAGAMGVDAVYGDDPSTVLRRGAAVERLSNHPLADAIVDHARDTLANEAAVFDDDEAACTDGGVAESAHTTDELPRDLDAFTEYTRGVSATVDGDTVLVGHPSLFHERGLTIDEPLSGHVQDARAVGSVPVVVGWGGRARGVIVVADTPREEWEAAIEPLATDREIVVLTGDDGAAADQFRAADCIDEVFAGVTPEAKAEAVSRLRSRGTVAMVGDGSNDAPALAAADIGIATGNPTELATNAADAIIVVDDLHRVADTFTIATGTNRRIRQNLGWAFCYNAIAIPLAIMGVLNPLFAALAMALSSLLVVTNSARPIGGD